jgi:hypothetical protein
MRVRTCAFRSSPVDRSTLTLPVRTHAPTREWRPAGGEGVNAFAVLEFIVSMGANSVARTLKGPVVRVNPH